MGSHRCLEVGSGCSMTVPRPATAPTDDILRFPINIGQPVALNLNSNAIDVKIIQRALNYMPVSHGGPKPPLKVDGIVGPKTNAAIITFQKKHLGWADGRVDPGKLTIIKLNELEPLWISTPPEVIDIIYQEILPKVRPCVAAANVVLRDYQSAKSAVGTPSFAQLRAQRLVEKHFALQRNPMEASEFALIQGVFLEMNAVLLGNTAATPDASRTFVAAPGRFPFSEMYKLRAVAMTMAGGRRLSGNVNFHTLDGQPYSVPIDKILITYPYIRTTADTSVCTLIHEMAHLLGGEDNSYGQIIDFSYGTPAELSLLTPQQRAHNAENYSNFAFEAFHEREPLNGLI